MKGGREVISEKVSAIVLPTRASSSWVRWSSFFSIAKRWSARWISSEV